MRKFAGILISSGILVFSVHAYAENTQLHGFVRAGGALSLSKEHTYLERIDSNGDTGDSHFGLTASSQLSENLDVAGQIFSTAKEGQEVVLDWAYGTYRVSDELKLSMGRIKYPNLLASEYVDIGVSYLWIRPPQELYSFEVEHGANLSLEAFNGGSISYDGAAGSFEYSIQAYAGDARVFLGHLNKMMGTRIKLGTDNFTMQVAYGLHTPVFDEFSHQVELNGHDVSVMSAGINADIANVLLSGEWASSSAGDEEHLKNTAYYGTVGYRIKSVTPHVTYSVLDIEEGRAVATVGVKYQINPSATFKMEVGHVMPEAHPGETAEAFQTVSSAVDFVF